MENRKRFDLSSAALHVLAMALMLCDHLWATIVPGNDWLTCIGRLAFPIFAFMLVEGYFHTKNVKQYALRLLIAAIVSEIPFNLMVSGVPLYPLHQNVLWSFLLSLGLIHWNERTKGKQLWLRILTGIASAVVGGIVGLVTMIDYLHAGILMALMFYFLRRRCWWTLLLQVVCMWLINAKLLGGLGYPIAIGEWEFFLPQQALAILALIPIWLYRGRQGYHTKWFQWTCYAFYPVHLLILGLLARLL